MAVVVTIAKGYDLGYIWKTQDHAVDARPAGTTSMPPRPGTARPLVGTRRPGPSASPSARPSNAGFVRRGLPPDRPAHRRQARPSRQRPATPPSPTTWPAFTAAEPHATRERHWQLARQAAPRRTQLGAVCRCDGVPGPRASRCSTPRSGRTSARPGRQATKRGQRTGPRRISGCRTSCRRPTWPGCGTPSSGPGSPAPGTTAGRSREETRPVGDRQTSR